MPFFDKNIARRIIVLVMLAVFSVTLFFLHGQTNYEINKIRFKGNKTFNKRELMENISIYEINFIERLLKQKEPSFYNEMLVQSDVERLVCFYQSRGFLYVNVSLLPPEVADKKRHSVNLTFEITENRPILIDSVSVKILNTPLAINEDSILKRINKRLEVKENKRFTDESLLTEVTRINSNFRRTGYAGAKTGYKLNLRSEDSKTGVVFSVSPGRRSRFDTTTVMGNRYISSTFIKKQLTYKKGEIFDEKKIDDTRRLIYDLQLFRVVSITPQFTDISSDSVVPIAITINEQPRLSTEFGVGYGTEEKFRAQVKATFRSFLGDARRLMLHAKHSSIEPYYVSLSFVEPRFFSKKLSLTVSPYFRRQIEPGFDTQTLGVNAPLNYKFNEHLNVTLSGYYDRVVLRLDTTGNAQSATFDDGKLTYDKSGAMGTLSYSTAFPLFDPVKGFSVSFGAKSAFIRLKIKDQQNLNVESFNYNKIWIDFRKYTDLGNSFTLASRGMVGGIFSSDSGDFIPAEDRFFSGGSNSVRGWARSMLGPLWENGKPKGGTSILEMNLELRRPLFWILNGAVFLDAGNVWEGSFHYRLNQLAYALGAGLRFNTPIGPIRLDVGFPMRNEKRTPQFFINVGQAF